MDHLPLWLHTSSLNIETPCDGLIPDDTVYNSGSRGNRSDNVPISA